MLEMIQRHAVVSPDKLAVEELAKPIDARKLKLDFVAAFNRANESIPKLDAQDLGCLFLDKHGNPLKDLNLVTGKSIRHYGTVKGSWPRVTR